MCSSVQLSFTDNVFSSIFVPACVCSAAEQGTQMLEVDCHITQDGHVVVSHDENLLRQTGRDVPMSSLSLQVDGIVPLFQAPAPV